MSPVIRSTIFAGVMLAMVNGIPLLAATLFQHLPHAMANPIYFWPQYALLPHGIRSSSGFLVDHHFTYPVVIVLWVILGLWFGWVELVVMYY